VIEQEYKKSIHDALTDIQEVKPAAKKEDPPVKKVEVVVPAKKEEAPVKKIETTAPISTAQVKKSPDAVQAFGDGPVPVPGMPVEGGVTKAVKTPFAYPPTPIGLYVPPPRDLVPKKEDKKDDDKKDEKDDDKKSLA